MTKAITDFTGYTAANLSPAAQVIHKELTLHAAVFPGGPMTLVALQAEIDDYDTKMNDRASGAYADTLAFNIARHQLEGTLGDFGDYVNSVAAGDATIVMQSGFSHYETGHAPDYNPPAAPANLVARQGDLSGSMVLRYRPDRQKSINEVQINTGDPNNEADWKPAGLFSGGKAAIGGIIPGTKVWSRVRTVGLKGVMGSWSDPAQLMVV